MTMNWQFINVFAYSFKSWDASAEELLGSIEELIQLSNIHRSEVVSRITKPINNFQRGRAFNQKTVQQIASGIQQAQIQEFSLDVNIMAIPGNPILDFKVDLHHYSDYQRRFDLPCFLNASFSVEHPQLLDKSNKCVAWLHRFAERFDVVTGSVDLIPIRWHSSLYEAYEKSLYLLQVAHENRLHHLMNKVVRPCWMMLLSEEHVKGMGGEVIVNQDTRLFDKQSLSNGLLSLKLAEEISDFGAEQADYFITQYGNVLVP